MKVQYLIEIIPLPRAEDYEKTTESSESWILLANCAIIINRLDNWPN